MTANPFDPFREIDRVFGQLGRSAAADARVMPMDLYRQGDDFVAKIDLPGVNPDSIDIDVDDRTLTIRAERPPIALDTSQDENVWLSRERPAGAVARQISLGSGLDLGKIDANYRDGVLTLTIPVAEEAKPRKIQVRTEQIIES
ncbi:MAG: Hsp20/alpha crystallin family protein [Bifidobacteriaceae bacterium]|jgi:HSP20 family protein|nr:Hsp20/alpha crystallin family protein [Bifidobacteriaceae bacterium]